MSSHPSLLSNPATLDNLLISLSTGSTTYRMGQLLDLPDEIITDICTLICDSDRLALFQVIYVNKRLYRIASPLLVRHWPFYRSTSHKQASAHFALHLIRNPDLQRNVKSLVFDGQLPIEDDPWGRYGELDELAAAARQRYPELADDPQWCGGLIYGWADHVAALLMLLCTRLESLDFMISYDQASRLLVLKLVSLALKHSGPQRPLENLQRVVLRWGNDEDPGNIQYAAPFFHLPNVKTLALSALSDGEVPIKSILDEKGRIGLVKLGWDPDIHEAGFPVGTSPIEELVIEAACLTCHGLLTVVSACKRLKKLVFTWRNPSRMNDDGHNSLTLTRQALLLHAASLEELAFDLITHRFRDDPTLLENASKARFECLKECFKQMTKLKRLTMDIHVLNYRDVSRNEKMLDFLPRSLEHLGLECDLPYHQPGVLEHVERLCEVLKACGPGNRFRALETLEIWLFVYDGIDKDIYEPVNELAREKGIKFMFTHASHGGGSTWKIMGMIPKPYPPIVNSKEGLSGQEGVPDLFDESLVWSNHIQ
ncbi:hypothetical protein FMUND_5328 [Fusarium mundagurra]|uniref:F-box domain-containing protein n=1 Tax=Fusarium mundagurra TaxID=1567541 RepID=A0A8H5YVQ5_9HYPO|nr:hypothetical protein FMUND_5328 [Fusarium mundagurra]